MDENQYISGGVGASVVIALIVLRQIYNAINHKRLRSTCCGAKMEASMDVDDTTPREKTSQVSVQVGQIPVESDQKGATTLRLPSPAL